MLFETLQIVRFVLGLLFVLFIPGYTISWALFPKKKQLDRIERVVLSVALSISTIPLVIFYLNKFLKIPIDVVTDIVVIASIIIISVIVWKRRTRE